MGGFLVPVYCSTKNEGERTGFHGQREPSDGQILVLLHQGPKLRSCKHWIKVFQHEHLRVGSEEIKKYQVQKWKRRKGSIF